MDGQVLDPVYHDSKDLYHVFDQLLRWHFRQSILANVRGEGELIFEHDFLLGTDIMKEICEGLYAQEWFERKLAARFRNVESKNGGYLTEELIVTWQWTQV